uniref:hypothetical protein n=1 Tax=Variovorax sp. YR752 TaxID=1884383 RepID=UPI0031377B86
MPTTISVYESFDAIPDAVRSALSFPGQSNFFLSLDWFELLQTTAMADTVRPRIYVLGDADGGVKAALFCCRPQCAGRRELRSLSNFYTIE